MKGLESIAEKFPLLAEIYDVVKSFKTILFNKAPNELDNRIERAKLVILSELNSFIKGIPSDIDEVKN